MSAAPNVTGLGTSDREVARLAAKALEAETDEEMKRPYRALSRQPLSASETSVAAAKVSRRAKAYLRQFTNGFDGSDQAFRKRHGTFERAEAPQTDLSALLKQIGDAPHEGQIELLDINRERSDYRTLARTIMLREIKALKRHLRDITDAELGQLASAGGAAASLSPAPVIPISADLAPDSSKRPTQLLDRFRHDSRERRGESALTSFATVIGYLEQVTEENRSP